MRVVITGAAKLELIGIGEYIRLYNPERAASFVAELLDHCQALSELPRRHPLVPRCEYHGIRRRMHADYLNFYRIGTELVEIIHILNGAQDYRTLMFPNA